MPWRCPACSTPIKHREFERRLNVRYRCSICHLELFRNSLQDRLDVAPTYRDAKDAEPDLIARRTHH